MLLGKYFRLSTTDFLDRLFINCSVKDVVFSEALASVTGVGLFQED